MKKIIAVLLTLTLLLQSSLVMAADIAADSHADAEHTPTVHEASTPVVDIAAPNAAGISHNKYNDFNVSQNGVILNNATQAANTTLAGNIAANPNLHNSASIILNEITGTNRTNLNGLIEVAGSRADVIIANPNGISGSGFGFINTNRAVLTTGIPQLNPDGSLASFRVTGGDVDIKANGLIEEKEPDRLDIYTRAAKINAQLWAKNDLNIITGANDVNYNTLNTTDLQPSSPAPEVSLDVGALGSMYAGKVMLIGTEKGLGVNLGGDISADEDIKINSAGKLTITNADAANLDNGITAGGKIQINADSLDNNSVISGIKDVDINAKNNINNLGSITAGQTDETEPAVSSNITITSADANISSAGTFLASKDINLTGKTVTYDKLNSTAQGTINVNETGTTPILPPAPPTPTPAPVPSGSAADKENTAANAKAPALTNIPDYANINTTKLQQKEKDLALTADPNAAQKQKPVIDKAANGVDLVQITAPNGSGISENKYQDFNVKPSGLIFNNAYKYTNTQLGGYIDSNSNMAQGHTAKIILNEVTGNNLSKINGYMEIAGDKADLILANPNGIGVNGAGFINTASATLTAANAYINNGRVNFRASSGDIIVHGDGINAETTENLNLTAGSITNDASEIWSNNLALNSDGILTNTGKINARQNIAVNTDTLKNNSQAIISSGKDLSINTNSDIENDNAAINSDGSSIVNANKIANTNKAIIKSSGSLTANIHDGLLNDTSIISSAEDMSITAAKKIMNNNASLSSKANLILNAQELQNENTDLSAQKDITISADNTVKNKNTLIEAGSDLNIAANIIQNMADTNIYADGNMTYRADNDINNDDSLIAAGGKANLTAKNLNNTLNSVIYSKNDMAIKVNNLLNSSSDIQSEANISIDAADIVNKKAIFDTDWIITNQKISYGIPHWDKPNYYSANRQFNREIKTGNIVRETPAAHISADKNIDIKTNNLKNHYSEITAGKALTIDAKNSVENFGYQGTVITTDTGHDNQNWKFKKKYGPPWRHKTKWVYGTTVVPYYNQVIVDQPTQRYGILSGRSVAIHVPTVINTTYDAHHDAITNPSLIEEPVVLPDVNHGIMNTGLAIDSMENNRIFHINQDPASKYLIETDPRFANYHNFLSSDYLLQRVKTDPTKTLKRLGDGYYEQQNVIDQISHLTGCKYDGDYNSSMEEYKALMDNGAAFAEKYNLSVGTELTRQQMAVLTSDIVWLVKENIDGQEVLVPKVYLSHLKEGDLKANGALIAGTDVAIVSPDTLENIGTIKADNNLSVNAGNIKNESGVIQGSNVNLKAEYNLENNSAVIYGDNVNISADTLINKTNETAGKYKELNYTILGDTSLISANNDLNISAKDSIKNIGADMAAGRNLSLYAGRDADIETVSKEQHVAVDRGGSFAKLDSRLHQGSSIASGNNININANDINMTDANVNAGNNAALTAKNNLNISDIKDDTASDASVGSRGGSFFERQQNDDEKVQGTSVNAKNNVSLNAGSDVNIKASGVSSDKNAVDINAKNNINIINDTEHHESTHELHKKDKGMFKSKTTDIYDFKTQDSVVKSSIEGNTIAGTADKDINIKASDVVADNKVTLNAGNNVNIVSADEKSGSIYEKRVKKSGLLSGGLGFTIGKESAKDKYLNENTEQVGSTVGSINNNVEIKAADKAKISASDVMAGKDIDITAGQVDIVNGTNTYHNKEDHEYKKSGLTVSLGGGIVNTVSNVVDPIKRAGEVEDDRLKALYGKKAYDGIKDVNKAVNSLKTDGIKGAVNLNVGIGSSKSESHSDSTTTEAASSNINATGNVNISANKTDVNIVGSNVTGKNININAKNDINLAAAQNSNKTDSHSSSSSSSIGMSFGIGGGPNASHSSSSENIKENGISYTAANVTAKDTLKTNSGADTNITGSKAAGDKVDMTVGKDLNIASVQNKDDYRENSKSSGASLGTGAISVSVSKGKMDSNYAGTVDQAGIYAGNKGFNITVADNTNLKGSVIDSNASPDKNKLTTGTITMEDIVNKADYNVSNTGISYNHFKEKNDKTYNQSGILPNLSPGAKNDASSVTHAAIAPGTITTTKENIDIAKINRDTKNSLSQLGQIFDKKKMEERQELAGLFAQEADKLLHNYDKDGSINKSIAHGIVAEITSQLAGNKAGSGFLAGAANEALIKDIAKISKNNPDVAQWISAALGATINKITGNNAATGAMTAQSGTKWNKYQFYNDIAYQLKAYYESGDYTLLPDGYYKYFTEKEVDGRVVGVFIDNSGHVFDFDVTDGNFANSGEVYGQIIINPNGQQLTVNKVDENGNYTGETNSFTTGEDDGYVTDSGFFIRGPEDETGNSITKVNPSVSESEPIANPNNDYTMHRIGDYLINHNINLKNMPGDYATISISGVGFKSGSETFIVDKFGNVYRNFSFSPGISTGIPAEVSFGWIINPSKNNFDTDDKKSEFYKESISGLSGSAHLNAGIGGTIAVSKDGGMNGEISAGANVEVSIAFGKTEYIGNIFQ